MTGGAGFIGSNLVRTLLEDPNLDITVVDDLSTGLKTNLKDLDVRLLEEDISDSKVSIFDERSFYDVIVHLAARGSVPRSIKDPIRTTSVNVIGTQNILELARKNRAHVIFSSSSSVYGKNPRLPKTEDDWIMPLSPYAASKAAAEAYVQAYAHSYAVPVSVFRFFNVFGPWQRPDHSYSAVIPKWIWSAMRDDVITVHGDGEQTRDFTFVGTVVQILHNVIWKSDPVGGPINLAFGNRISLNSVLELLRKQFPNLRVDYGSPRDGDIRESQNDPERLMNEFPDIVPVPFEEAFVRTTQWFAEQLEKGIDS